MLPTHLRCALSLYRGTRLNVPLVSAARPLLSSSPLPAQHYRWSSHSPYGAHSPLGTQTEPPRKKVTISTLRSMYKKNEPISMITAHDFPSAHVADAAGMDVVLVGDSLAMVAMGMDDTSEVLVEEMLLHCRSVARATKAAFTVSRVPLLDHHYAAHAYTMTDW